MGVDRTYRTRMNATARDSASVHKTEGHRTRIVDSVLKSIYNENHETVYCGSSRRAPSATKNLLRREWPQDGRCDSQAGGGLPEGAEEAEKITRLEAGPPTAANSRRTLTSTSCKEDAMADLILSDFAAVHTHEFPRWFSERHVCAEVIHG